MTRKKRPILELTLLGWVANDMPVLFQRVCYIHQNQCGAPAWSYVTSVTRVAHPLCLHMLLIRHYVPDVCVVEKVMMTCINAKSSIGPIPCMSIQFEKAQKPN